MATPHRKVLDLSHHNDILSWSQIVQAGIVGIIHKATEGDYNTDGTYVSRRQQALDHGLLWGAYHFATDDRPQDQVDRFLGVAGEDAATLYCLDWEDYGSSTMSTEQAREFMSLLDGRLGDNRCVLYSGNRAKEALGSRQDEFFGAHRLWLAQYGSSPVVQPSWGTYWLWQYSDGNAGPQPHGCPGCGGDVDTNSWEGTDEQLRAEWAGAPAVPVWPPLPARTAVVNVNVTTTGPVIILVNGRLVEV